MKRKIVLSLLMICLFCLIIFIINFKKKIIIKQEINALNIRELSMVANSKHGDEELSVYPIKLNIKIKRYFTKSYDVTGYVIINGIKYEEFTHLQSQSKIENLVHYFKKEISFGIKNIKDQSKELAFPYYFCKIKGDKVLIEDISNKYLLLGDVTTPEEAFQMYTEFYPEIGTFSKSN